MLGEKSERIQTFCASPSILYCSSQGGKLSKRLGGNMGCKDKTSSWHLIGFSDGSNIGSTV